MGGGEDVIVWVVCVCVLHTHADKKTCTRVYVLSQCTPSIRVQVKPGAYAITARWIDANIRHITYITHKHSYNIK